MVRVMVLEPGKHAEVRFICPKTLPCILGGKPEFCEALNGITIAVNEEGKLKGLPLNRSLVDEDGDVLDIFAGTMVVFGCGGDHELRSLTDEEVILLLEELGAPETPDDWSEEDVTLSREDIHALLDEFLEKIF